MTIRLLNSAITLTLQYKVIYAGYGRPMSDVENALSHIAEIRGQLAASIKFRGFAPQAVAVTAMLAFGTAGAQALAPDEFANTPEAMLGLWVMLAPVCVLIIATEALARARTFHGGMAQAMIDSTLRQFLPPCAAGAVITLILFRLPLAPLWILPGLWQILLALGIFASAASLPKAMWLAAAWYFICGVVAMAMLSKGAEFSPWSMGLPFGLGQALVAAILHRANGGKVER